MLCIDTSSFIAYLQGDKEKDVEGYWERTGLLRAKILQQGYKARLADTLIAQNCLDHHALLITRDKDFKIYKEIAGLRLAQAP